jgi:ubiquinone/menaquinone biosynthesis C-methylase UbiE
MLERFLAGQFARPHGAAGRWLLGPLLDGIGEPMMAAAFAALDARPGELVLDLGFGGGALTRWLLNAGVRVVGVDRSNAMVARAARRHRRAIRKGQADFKVGSASLLPLRDASIDRAASVNTLYFWPALQLPLDELHRVLKPGGTLLLCYQRAQSVRAWPGHVHGFTAHEDAAVDAAIAVSGFQLQTSILGQNRRIGAWRCLTASVIP